MTYEDRERRNNMLAMEIVPNLLNEDTKKSLGTFSVQDLIVIEQHANTMLKRRHLSMDREQEYKFKKAVNEVRYLYIEKFKLLDVVYFISDNSTRLPFVDDEDCAYAFTEKEFAESAADYFNQQYRNWTIVAVKYNDIVDFIYRMFYMNGVKGIIIDNGQTYSCVKRDEIFDEQSVSPLVKRNVVSNPEFLLALSKFQQERAWKISYPEKMKKLKSFEDDMIKAFCEAKFLIPIKDFQVEPDADNEAMENGIKVYLPRLKRTSTEFSQPVFTDWYRFKKIYDKSEHGAWIWSAKDLLNSPENVIAINISDICFEVTKEMISQMLKIYGEEFYQTKADVAFVEKVSDVFQGRSQIEREKKILHEINDGKLYYVPFLYSEETENVELDEDTYCLSNCLSHKPEDVVLKYVDGDKEMDFSRLKNAQSGKEYFPLFSSVKLLREAFPVETARICLCGKEVIEKFAGQSSGVIVDLSDVITNEFMRQFGYNVKIVTSITCPVCKSNFQFSDGDIPIGEMYEVKCPSCDMLIRRKHV